MARVVEACRKMWDSHPMILALAIREVQSRYTGTLGGLLWAFVQPVAIVAIFYFVFVIGFRSQGPANTPYILWFVGGLVPWFLFAETLPAMTNAVTGRPHLVKKIVFPTEILPLANLAAGFFSHAIFLLIMAALLVFYNIQFQAERLLVIYFFFCSCMLLIGLGWMLSALQVFYRDISQGLTIAINMCFWITPIAWSSEIMPKQYQGLFSYNPIYYIVEGYRGLLIYDSIIWPTAGATAYFWAVTVLFGLAGAYIFRRLKPEFPDVI